MTSETGDEKVMMAIEIVGIVLLLVVGIGLLTGNKLMEKAVHKDAAEAEEYLANAKKAQQRTSA